MTFIMGFLIQFFKIILYQPFLNILVLFYVYLPGHDFGVAVILLTIIIRLLLFPVSRRALISQKQMAELQPKIQKIKQKYKNNKQQQTQEMLKLYKQGNISPASGCLPFLLQLPVLIALYHVFLKGLTPQAMKQALYGFVPYPGEIVPTLFGLFDLSKPFWYTANGATHYYFPTLVLGVLAGIAQFVQTKLTVKDSAGNSKKKNKSEPQFASMMQSQMLYFMPLIMVFIILKFGSIIGLYLLVSILFSIGEHYFIKSRTG